MTAVEIVEAPPLLTVQDAGRPGNLVHGVSASGPMDCGAYHRAGTMLNHPGSSCLEFGSGKLVFRVVGGDVTAAFAGGDFIIHIDGRAAAWEGVVDLSDGATVSVVPGLHGNFGVIRFTMDLEVPLVMNSRATNLVAALGGMEGRALRAGDCLAFTSADATPSAPVAVAVASAPEGEAAIRVMWGIHAELFSQNIRHRFVTEAFAISARLDRMGMGLLDINGVFTGQRHLTLVSDAVVPGDIQILGDGTPVVLMRDHQPTGGYPRIATVIGPDLDRLAQMRPGCEVRFGSVAVQHAHRILSGK